jgi:hypothetical protein
MMGGVAGEDPSEELMGKIAAFFRERAEVERAGGYRERCVELSDGGRFLTGEKKTPDGAVHHYWVADAGGQRYGCTERVSYFQEASDEEWSRAREEVELRLLIQAWMTLAIVTGRVPAPTDDGSL